MSKKIGSLFLFASILLAFYPLFSETRDTAALPLKYKKWLEEEVVYIITTREREVFLKLQTDRERDLFIDAFWKHRNPNPLSERNVFKDELYSRIDYANRIFGRGASVMGWKTDRGRIYIKLGPPVSVQAFENFSYVYPAIVWYYQGMRKLGLPDSFNIIFFRKRGVGNYRLYSPSLDGPESLVANYSLSQYSSYSSAYQVLKEEAPVLAQAALSLIPGEPIMGETSSPTSDRLLFDIDSTPQKAIKDDYAEKSLLYKDIVEVEYSANYIDNTSLVSIVKDSSGIFFVNYLLELDKFSVNQFGKKYSTRLNVIGKVSDSDGKTIYQYERTIPIEFDQQRFDLIRVQKYSFKDLFPLIEGKYRFNLLVKNEASKEFTSIEKEISVPSASAFGMSRLVLAYKAETDAAPNKLKAYQAGELILYPSLRLDFIRREGLYLYSQIFGMPEKLRNEGFLKFIFIKGEEVFKTKKKYLIELPLRDFILEELPLAEFPPAYYRVIVSVCDKSGKEIISDESPFSVSPALALPRPWTTVLFHLPANDPGYIYIQGRQWQSQGNLEKAKILLETAYKANPSFSQFALSYANVLFSLKQNQPVVKILTPFLAEKKYEVLELLARAHQALGEYEKAISLYRENLAHFGLNFIILNFVGECYFQVGKMEEALKAWEQSLIINPNQAELNKFLKSLKTERK